MKYIDMSRGVRRNIYPMEKTQPIIVPAMAHIPQLSPQQIVEKRLKYTTPVIITPAAAQQLPHQTRTSLSQQGYPSQRYVPRKTRRKEPGPVETLMGCGILLVIGLLGLLLLYYIATGP
jgi:hypothetical protein